MSGARIIEGLREAVRFAKGRGTASVTIYHVSPLAMIGGVPCHDLPVVVRMPDASIDDLRAIIRNLPI